MPVISQTYIAQTEVKNAVDWYEFDVTNYVRARQQAGDSSITFALLADAINVDLTTFNSLEADINQPQLAITPLSPTFTSVTALEDASVRGGM